MGKVSSSGLRLCRERYALLASLLPVGMFQGSSKEKPGVRRDFSGIQDIGVIFFVVVFVLYCFRFLLGTLCSKTFQYKMVTWLFVWLFLGNAS